MNIKLICDSLCDIPDEIQSKDYIEVVPLTLIMDGVEYKDGVDIDKDTFYKKVLESNDIPKTSQATYIQFKEVFDRAISEGKKILCINGASTKSGTYQSAVLAKNDTEGDITVFDTENLSLGAGQFVIRACDMIEEGLDIPQIVDKLDEIKSTTRILFAPATFDFLKKSGRVHGSVALIGNMLNLKPIMKMEAGEITQDSKVRGTKKLISALVNHVVENCGDSIGEYTVTIGYGCNLEDFEKLKKEAFEKLNGKVKKLMVTKGGVCICSHTGPDIVAISFSK